VCDPFPSGVVVCAPPTSGARLTGGEEEAGRGRAAERRCDRETLRYGKVSKET
jgi:hypothetical protein